MASSRRIGLSTAVKITRRIDASTAIKQWSMNKNRYLSTAVKPQWRGVPEWPSRKFRYFENRFIRHPPTKDGYTVDVADLLFTPERDFLVKNNGQKIKVDDLLGKTIVLCMVPLDVMYVRRLRGKVTCDMIDAYCELLRIGSNVEFVFLPLLHRGAGSLNEHFISEEASHRSESISKWDQLLTSDTRDFLLSSNGDKVPISSLKGKLVGLYLCENIPRPPRMQAIKKVYEEAKSRGYDFEIVQITFHYHPFNAKHLDTDPTVQQYCEDVSWLTLPFKDPSCRKVQRILRCKEEEDEEDKDDIHWVGDCLVDKYWAGDSLVLIYPRQGEAEAVLFELSGAKILQRWGIEGYPFTQLYRYKAEYELQKREVTLQLLFPPGEHLLRIVGDGFDLVDPVSQLSGKRVLVLFAPHSLSLGVFGDMLKSEYHAQSEDNVAKESKFEVVYVSTSFDESTFDEFTKDMPWLIRPFSPESDWSLLCKVFKSDVRYPCAAAFNEQGELIAKADNLDEKKEGDKLQFPFIDQDLEKRICMEVEAMCDVANYRRSW